MEAMLHEVHSAILGRTLPFQVYGHGGRPILVFPTQNGRSGDYAEFGMPDTIADRLEAGEVQLFCVDSIDSETWSDKEAPKAQRSWLQELWFRHITLEFIPEMMTMNGSGLAPIVTGCSMGGTHSLNTFLRRPDLFHGVIALSGAYDARYFFGDDFMDGHLYDNSIVDYMANLPEDHFYIPLLNSKKIVICTGQGAWEEEMVRTTTMVRDIFERKGIRAWIDFWGKDVNHDWPWWRKQLPYFLDSML